jgi:hypothetical protein
MEQVELPLGIVSPGQGGVAAEQAGVPVSIATGPTVRLRLLIGYLGTDFHGLAPQPGLRTVVGLGAGFACGRTNESGGSAPGFPRSPRQSA